jgi:hypothetical protein
MGTESDDKSMRELSARWARAGAMFDVEPTSTTPDLERLLLDTARQARADARLLVMAATWLTRYGSLVARHRLNQLVGHELAPSDRVVLGFLLELVRNETDTSHFNGVIALCRECAGNRRDNLVDFPPLFEVYRGRPALLARLGRQGSALARSWGMLADPIEFKLDALRPARWVVGRNPSFRMRADLGGDLRCSVLITLEHDPDAGRSESNLARECGVTRRALRLALDQLEMAGRIEYERKGNRKVIRLAHRVAA